MGVKNGGGGKTGGVGLGKKTAESGLRQKWRSRAGLGLGADWGWGLGAGAGSSFPVLIFKRNVSQYFNRIIRNQQIL